VAVDEGWWRLIAGIGRRRGTEGERTGREVVERISRVFLKKYFF
jgi:hypothetical protein